MTTQERVYKERLNIVEAFEKEAIRYLVDDAMCRSRRDAEELIKHQMHTRITALVNKALDETLNDDIPDLRSSFRCEFRTMREIWESNPMEMDCGALVVGIASIRHAIDNPVTYDFWDDLARYYWCGDFRYVTFDEWREMYFRNTFNVEKLAKASVEYLNSIRVVCVYEDNAINKLKEMFDLYGTNLLLEDIENVYMHDDLTDDEYKILDRYVRTLERW